MIKSTTFTITKLEKENKKGAIEKSQKLLRILGAPIIFSPLALVSKRLKFGI